MKTKKKHLFWKILLIVLAVLAAALVFFYRWQNPQAIYAKRWIKYEILHMEPDLDPAETEGLGSHRKVTLYINGEKTGEENYEDSGDLKRVIDDGTVCRLINYNDGYQLDFPSGTTFDFSLSEKIIRAYGDGYAFTVSCEHSPYENCNDEMTNGLASMVPWYSYEDGVDQYIGYYESRFLLNEDWQQNNGVTVTHTEEFDANGHEGIIFHADISDVENDNYDAYSYIYLKTGGVYYIRVLAKYYQENTELRDSLEGYYSYLRFFDCTGTDGLFTDYQPVIPENWSDETLALYEKIVDSDTVSWGIYAPHIYDQGIDETIPALEEELNYRFQVVLSYAQSPDTFPTEFMQKNWDNGRLVELTYQITDNNNSNLCESSQMLDLYRGVDVESIREFARAAKAFGHPFLFRMCNEMNSDWCSYSGVANMADPDVFIDMWHTVYEIFQEEGVDNCIWVFNPNDRDCPPTCWNDSLAYYPGDDYVQLIGVTGYNNGTYYEKWSEEWREFDVIYDQIQEEYGEIFGSFPWMITEFACSGVGGDKPAWIDNMFEKVGNYPNIKIAVWFDEADYDTDGTPARTYWLDETEKTLAAFKRGLQNYSSVSWVG